jgi:rhodanese-related sulfurtransferase
MTRYILALVIAMLAFPAAAYDEALADSYQAHFAAASGKGVGKALHAMPADAFIAAVKKGEKIIILDVRTPAETRFVGAGTGDVLYIPVNQVFEAENLARLPTEGKVVVMCAKGFRAAMIASALRHTGFDNVYFVKGGFAAVANMVNPKTAH